MKLILVGGAYINAEDVAAIGSHPVMSGGCTIYFKFGAPTLCIPAGPEEVDLELHAVMRCDAVLLDVLDSRREYGRAAAVKEACK